MSAVNFSTYLPTAGSSTTADPDTMLNYAEAWISDVEMEWLANKVHPLKAAYLAEFRKQVRAEVQFIGRLGVTPTSLQVRSRFDRIFEKTVGAIDPNTAIPETDCLVLGPPKVAHDNEFTTAGVKCIGAIINAQGALVGLWANRPAYSGNHSLGKTNPYVGGDGSTGPSLKLTIPARNSLAYKAVKPNISTGLKLLDKERHAEDGWFASYFEAFYKDVAALPGLATLPALSTLNICLLSRNCGCVSARGVFQGCVKGRVSRLLLFEIRTIFS